MYIVPLRDYPIPKVSEKKWATGQSFIRKEITTYRIGTLTLSEIISNIFYATIFITAA